ncbi:MAG TPA: class I SAM-dependent methyltransferase [Streptosporangiaceae bacterium]|nr:class I SAM-dependent methyltransferase [Streptosporangiaceae bacterium]
MTSASNTAPPAPYRWRPGQLARRIRKGLVDATQQDRLELLRAVPIAERPLLWLEEHPALHGLVLSAFGLRRPIFIDHPMRPEPRFGHGRPEHPEIAALLGRNRARYAERLEGFLAHSSWLAAIPLRDHKEGSGPYWDNGWLPPLDALALYGFLAETNPRRFVEIGSGNSTKFARRAIDDHSLRTHITSIDPVPRAHIDALCDLTVRSPLEQTDLDVFSGLDAGDIVFFDGSHRVFMGSDVTVFFFEVLPRLRPGVLVHIHDIMLPRDYPPGWRWRYYSEQYLLAAFLLANPSRFDVELPNAFVHGDGELRAAVEPLWRKISLAEEYGPASFWLRIIEQPPAACDSAAGKAAT